MIRPEFIKTLLARPLPNLHPPSLTASKNKPYDIKIRNSLADLHCDPRLEACCHLMNEDLFTAHFLVRKFQEVSPEDPLSGFGTMLHGSLHASEGDYCNAKCWYHDTPDSILTQVFLPYPNNPELTPRLQASHLIDSLSLSSGISPTQVRADTEKAKLNPEVAWTAQELQDRIRLDADGSISLRVRRLRWGELVSIMEILEKEVGWGEVCGTTAYVKDSDRMKAKSLIVTGEGWRKW